MAAGDAADRGLGEGDLLEISTPAGPGRGPAADQRHPAGVVFLPFHYGYWDTDGRRRRPGARPTS